MAKRYIVTLTTEERETLQALISSGTERARKLAHARVLLKADEGWQDKQISEALDVGTATIERVRQRFVLEGLEAALSRRPPTREYLHKLDGEGKAHLTTLACSTPPKGHDRWSLRLLADKMVESEYIDSISYETVRPNQSRLGRMYA
jgi:transposase